MDVTDNKEGIQISYGPSCAVSNTNFKVKQERIENVVSSQHEANMLKMSERDSDKINDIAKHSSSEMKVYVVTNDWGDDQIGMEMEPTSSPETKMFIVSCEDEDKKIGTEMPSSAGTKQLSDSCVLQNTRDCSKETSREYTDIKNIHLPSKLNSVSADGNIFTSTMHDNAISSSQGDFENSDETKQNIPLNHDSLCVTDFLEKETVNDLFMNKESDKNLPDSKSELSVPNAILTENKELEFQVQADTFVTEDDVSNSSCSENLANRSSTCRKDSLRRNAKRKYGPITKRKLERKTNKSTEVKIMKQSSVMEDEKMITHVNCNSKKNKGKRKQKSQLKDNISDSSDENKRSSKTQVRGDDKQFQCHVCGKFLKSTSAVIVHQRIHTGEKPFLCTICKKRFSVKVSLNRHLRTHSGEKPYVCSFCNDSFGQAASLKRHLGRHTGNYPFKCNMCEKRYIQHSDLVGHLRSHTGIKREKSWICEVCGSGFVSTRNLVRHVKWVHIAEKPFVCDICGKGFVELGKLTAHQRYHTGERPFKCSVCERGFVDKGYLREHMKIHEEKEKKTFKCKMCEKGFSTSKNLYRHIRTIHTKEEVYTCNICWKNFGQAGNLKIHRLRHHKDVTDSASFSKPGSSIEDDDDEEIYETYICSQDKVYAKKLSHNNNGSLLEDSSGNKMAASLIDMSSKSILQKFGYSKLKSSSAERLNDGENKTCLNNDSKLNEQELTELIDNDCQVESLDSTVDEND